MNARLSKAQRDALARQDAPFLPLGLVTGDPRSTEAHLRHAAGLLGDRQVTSPCSRLITHLTALFEKSLPAAQVAMLACRAGCSFCCNQPVAVSAPEAFFLASYIAMNQPGRVEGVVAAAALAATRQPDARGEAWFACSLLEETGTCSVYRARPLACRAHVSVNAAACEAELARPGSGQVMPPQSFGSVKEHCRAILFAALQIQGLPLTLYEMNAAVAVALAEPHAEKRWLRGEDIFAHLPAVSPLKPESVRLVQWLAQNIAPTL